MVSLATQGLNEAHSNRIHGLEWPFLWILFIWWLLRIVLLSVWLSSSQLIIYVLLHAIVTGLYIWYNGPVLVHLSLSAHPGPVKCLTKPILKCQMYCVAQLRHFKMIWTCSMKNANIRDIDLHWNCAINAKKHLRQWPCNQNQSMDWCVTGVVGSRPKCSVVSVHFPFILMSPTKQQTKATTVKLTGLSATNKVNYPPRKEGKRDT